MATGQTNASVELDVLVLVKAYPNPSKTVAEAACIAGVDRQHRFVRLYPVPFRDLENEQQFQKYQWIRVNARKARSDSRPETYRPDLASIRVLTDPLPTTDDWATRREAVLPARTESVCVLLAEQKRTQTSLGVFQPAEVLDFTWDPEASPDWTPEERSLLTQPDLFMTRERKLLEKVPYTFRYRFRCVDCKAKKPHRLKIVDWELAQQYRRLVQAESSVEAALQKLRDNWLSNLCGPKRDTSFFVGNMQAFPNSFLVLGVFWPPKPIQLGLFR